MCLSCTELLTEYSLLNLCRWNLELYFTHSSLQVLVCGWIPLWHGYRQFLYCFSRTTVLDHTSNDVMVVGLGVCSQEMWYQVLTQTQPAGSSLGGNALFFFKKHYYSNALTFSDLVGCLGGQLCQDPGVCYLSSCCKIAENHQTFNFTQGIICWLPYGCLYTVVTGRQRWYSPMLCFTDDGNANKI